MQEGLTLQQVVGDIVNNVTTLSVIAAPVIFGVIEIIKKLKFPSKYAGLLAAPIGVLIMFLIQGFSFTSIGILVGILTGFATSGLYSGIKSAVPKQ